MDIHSKLVHAVTEYDRKQSTRPGFNRWALPQYLGAIQEGIMPDIQAGMPVRKAIATNFNGRLADVCLRAVGEQTLSKDEHHFGVR